MNNTLNKTRKRRDPESKTLSSVRTELRTQEIENEDPSAVFSCSLLPRRQQPSHLRTQTTS